MRLACQTEIVRIVIDGQIVRQYLLESPMTISEIWHDHRICRLGPSRMASLSLDGIAVVSISKSGYTAALKRRGLVK